MCITFFVPCASFFDVLQLRDKFCSSLHSAVLINIKYSIIFVLAYTWAGRPSKLLGTAQAQDKASEALRGRLNNMGCVMWGGGGWVLVFPSYS